MVKSNKTSDLTMEVDLHLDPSFLEVLEYGTFLPLLTPFIRWNWCWEIILLVFISGAEYSILNYFCFEYFSLTV